MIRPGKASALLGSAVLSFCLKSQKPPGKNLGFVKLYFGNFIDNPEILGIIQFCMDMKKVCRIPNCGVQPNLAGSKLLVGAKQLKKGLLAGTVKTVYLAQNADPNVTEPIAELCARANIQPVWVRTKAELGQICGIEVGAAAAGTAEE